MKKILLGNEAIVQGALAAGVSFVSGYPGCPSAEIGDEFIKIAKESKEYPRIYAEWSTNEKTALEAAIGASFSGLKSLVHMKSFGMNVASDVLLPLAYTGTKAGMVIFVGDDPSCHSSAQSEQDSRGYAYLSQIPFLEPSDPQECYDFTKLGFEISEKFNIPVILRTTTRVAHQRALVKYETPKPGVLYRLQSSKGGFVPNRHQFVTMPPRVMEMKKELLEKVEKIRVFADKSQLNKILRSKTNQKLGIITSGVSYLHTMEALNQMNLDLPVLKLGFFYPLPEKKIADFIKDKKKILVVEELNPYLEKEVKIIARENNPKLEIYGKSGALWALPEIGELNTEKICITLAKITGKKFTEFKIKNSKIKIPRRTARLCEGCPYWNVFPILKRIAPLGTIFTGDIGCNMIAGLSPHDMQDTLFCMGASMGISHGISKAEGHESHRKVVALIGDGTFFHSGIAGLINIVYNKSSPLIIILDNRTTAMTGHQPNPGQELSIEEIAKACGVKNVKTLDQINMAELEAIIKEFLAKDEVSVIICKRICALLARRQKNGE